MAEGAITYSMRVDIEGPMTDGHRAFMDAIFQAIRDLDDVTDVHLTVDDDGPGDYTRATDPRDNGRNER